MPRVVSQKRGYVWQGLAGLVVLALGCAVLFWPQGDPTEPPKKESATSGTVGGGQAQVTPTPPVVKPESQAGSTPVRVHKPASVVANRTADVPDGFRGDLHPLLHGRTQLEVTAHWTPLEKSQLTMEAPDAVQSWYTRLRSVVPRTTYTAREFSAFLPTTVTEVGQVWALDSDKIQLLLRQFHPNPSLHLVASGRRAGPDGAFAVLRAVSSTHLDIVFRLHAEFFITPNVAGNMQSVYAWFTPAYFSGRVLVNKTTGTVDYFRLALPTEKALNVFLTVNPSLLGIPVIGHDIVRVERMELAGGDERLVDQIAWTKSLSPTDAHRRLARVFYKFEQIEWVPLDQVQALARSKNRPIFAIVSWGSTDDQSC